MIKICKFENSVEVEMENVVDPTFHELLDIFKGHDKLQDYQATLSKDKTVSLSVRKCRGKSTILEMQ